MIRQRKVFVEVYTMPKGKYDWKKSLMKIVKVGLPVLVAGIASVYGDNPYYLALAPTISTLANICKHKWGIDLKVV